jgi:hypothetical protein
MPKKIDMTGQKFNRLTVLEECGKTNDGKVKWLCLCDCGNVSSVSGKHLRNGQIKSCGCFNKERSKTHGMSKTHYFGLWAQMISRCENANDSSYSRYGAKGIKVCDRWHSFENFLADMGDRPENTSIDRIDGSGNYEPSNCRWATAEEQAENRKTTRLIKWNGKTQSIVNWAKELGINKNVIKSRLTLGWSVDRSFSTPVRQSERRVEFNGKSQPLNHWAKELNVSQSMLWDRLYTFGWSVDRAFTTPSTKTIDRTDK